MFYISCMRIFVRLYNETLRFIKYPKRKIKLAYEFDTSIIYDKACIIKTKCRCTDNDISFINRSIWFFRPGYWPFSCRCWFHTPNSGWSPPRQGKAGFPVGEWLVARQILLKSHPLVQISPVAKWSVVL